MLIGITLTLMVSCSADDDGSGSNDGSAAAYTEDEVKAILKGKWEISGIVNITFNDGSNSINDEYSGNIQFGYGGTTQRYRLEITESKMHNANIERQYIDNGLSTTSYTLSKKNGKYFISYQKGYWFEFLSLSKNTFKTLLDNDLEYEDFNTKEKKKCHVRMTLNSQ